MSTFSENLASRVFNSNGYKELSDSLFGSYVLSLTGQSKKIDKREIKKLISSAQIFLRSNDKDIRNEGSIILSILLDLYADEYKDIVPISYRMFVQSGDFPNIRLLNEKFTDLQYAFNIFDEVRSDIRMSINSVEKLDFPLTDFQRSLWQDLESGNDVITSAPTSAGKSHIIMSYLIRRIAFEEDGFAAIVVPTRALISEVAAKIYEIARSFNCEEHIEVCTVPKEDTFGSKTFFVMTQERLYEILQGGDIRFDYLFIDEAHNITDQSRGVLLHLTVEKMLEDSNPQIIISMPSSIYQNSFSSIFEGIDFKKEITEISPVSKIIMSVIPKGTKLHISRNGSSNEKSIRKGFTKKRFSDIVYRLGNGESNIIYRNKTNECEKIAADIADLIIDPIKNPILDEAADYVEKFVHEEFSLAKNLRKGVAFHYGPLPSSVRVMIENLVKGDHVKYVACTSTLAEGVNLPAKNLFLKNPLQLVQFKKSERLEDVKIKNITGRAGRMLHHFSGNIFLVEPDSWSFNDYFDSSDEEEEKIPTYFKSLNEEYDSIIEALNGTYEHDNNNQYRIYTIANKLIKEFSNEALHKTLDSSDLLISKDQIEKLVESIKNAIDNIKIANFTLEANPSIGYIQQNKLYSFMKDNDSLVDWVLPHPRSNNLYGALVKVAEKLFESGIFIPSTEYSIDFISLIASKWIKGESLKDIISDQIKWDIKRTQSEGRDVPSVNSSVRDVIKAINNDIRFRLSNALKCYNLLFTNVIAERELDLTSIKLHTYIEVGACDERMINLISLGLSREAAKDIDEHASSDIEIKTTKDLRALIDSKNLMGIHAITKKEIVELLK